MGHSAALGVGELGERLSGVGVSGRGWNLGQVVGTVDTGSGVRGPGLVSGVPAKSPFGGWAVGYRRWGPRRVARRSPISR